MRIYLRAVKFIGFESIAANLGGRGTYGLGYESRCPKPHHAVPIEEDFSREKHFRNGVHWATFLEPEPKAGFG
jgi:hypothetical protein